MKNKISFQIFTYIVPLTLLPFLFNGCKSDKPEYSNIPSIELQSVTPTTVNELTDSIAFTIFYEDGDGDIGENTAGVNNLFLTDNRIGITYPYRIPQQDPGTEPIHLQGKLNIILKNTGITDGSNQQTATFSVYLKDRSGNQSNTVVSSPITIKKP